MDQFDRKKVQQASLFSYENGSMGPVFGALDKEVSIEGSWPIWADKIPRIEEPPLHAEGGLRLKGHFKSGSSEMPLVSYVTIVKNNHQTLERAIISVQQQTYPNVEHVILDGASTDTTMDIILQHEDEIDYFASDLDSGLYDALNKAVPLARGQVICILNSDDWLERNAAEIAVKYLRDKVEKPVLLLTAAEIRDGKTTQEWFPAFVHPGSYFICANVCHNGIYATRMAYEKSGPYDASYKIAADFKWIMECLDAGANFMYTKEPTVNFSLGGVSSDLFKHQNECMNVIHDRFPFLSDKEVSGLSHCFFLFQSRIPKTVERPLDLTAFLKGLYMKYNQRKEFLYALGWASVAKLNHPSDIRPHFFSSTIKQMKLKTERALVKHPKMYFFIRRIYLRIMK